MTLQLSSHDLTRTTKLELYTVKKTYLKMPNTLYQSATHVCLPDYLSNYLHHHCVLDDWPATRSKPLRAFWAHVHMYGHGSSVPGSVNRCRGAIYAGQQPFCTFFVSLIGRKLYESMLLILQHPFLNSFRWQHTLVPLSLCQCSYFLASLSTLTPFRSI